MINKIKDVSAAEFKKIFEKIKELPKPEFRCRQTQYAFTIDFVDGKFLERTWAFRRNKKKKGHPLEVKEVVRRLEGSNIILFRDVYFSMMGGYNVIWEFKQNGYYAFGPDDVWYRESAKYCNFEGYRLYTLDDAILLDSSIKFCAYPGFGGFIQYICSYRKYPEIEMLSKFGMTHLISDSRCCKRIRKDKDFRKFLARNKVYTQVRNANYVDLLNAYKLGLDIPKYLTIKVIYKNSTYKNNLDIFKGKEDMISNYLMKQNADLTLYFDYFEAAKEFIDMSLLKNLFPKKINEAHDFYMDKKQIKEKNPEFMKKFDKVVKKYSKLNYTNNSLIIRIAKNIKELISEGRMLHHCLGKMHYDSKMVKEESLIFFVRKIENSEIPYYTVEFDPKNKKVLQVRTDHNRPAIPEVNYFLNEWKQFISLKGVI